MRILTNSDAFQLYSDDDFSPVPPAVIGLVIPPVPPSVVGLMIPPVTEFFINSSLATTSSTSQPLISDFWTQPCKSLVSKLPKLQLEL